MNQAATMTQDGIKTSGAANLIRLVKGNCPIHGEITGRLLQGNRMECPKCADGRARMEAAATGIPRRFICKSLDEYTAETPGQQKALSTAKGYAKGFEQAHLEGAGLLFVGGVGTGKTHLACGIANHVRASGRSVLYTNARHAVGSIKDSWRRDSAVSETAARQRFITPDLLILDEIGVQFGTEAERVLLFDIIDGRYGRMQPVIVISNLDLPALDEMLGKRSVDRLRENGQLVRFQWESYRR